MQYVNEKHRYENLIVIRQLKILTVTEYLELKQEEPFVFQNVNHGSPMYQILTQIHQSKRLGCRSENKWKTYKTSHFLFKTEEWTACKEPKGHSRYYGRHF